MSQLFNTGVVVGKGNSSIVPLAAYAEFIGTTDDVTSYEEIDINVAGSPLDAPGELYFEFSPDGYNWDISICIGGGYLSGPSIVPQLLRVVLPRFRVRYINGSIPQTSFRLTTIYHRSTGGRLTRYLNQSIDYTEPLISNRSVIIGERLDGYFENLASNLDNQLLTESKLTDGINGDVAVKGANTPAISTDNALVVAVSPNNPLTTAPAKSSTVVATNIMAAGTSTELLASNVSRLGATIYNDSQSGLLYINLGASADSSDFVTKLLPLTYYELPFGFTGQVNGIWSVLGGFARVCEFTA